MLKRLIIASAIIAGVWSCKPSFNPGLDAVTLAFSQDTVFLDTVFSTIGSSTRTVRIINESNQDVLISDLRLGMGEDSPYRINVNGDPGWQFDDIQLPANDSIYVFVEVTAPVNGLEYLWTDSIVMQNGGLVQDIDLVTLAWDAHFHYATHVLVLEQPEPYEDIRIPYTILPSQAVWQNDKPHVVYGYAVVDSGGTLDIMAGTQVHFHHNSGIWVSSHGSLNIDPNGIGSYDNPTTLQGDRLEPFYENIAGQWGGVLGCIFIQRGAEADIQNAWIRNGTIGIRSDSVPEGQPANISIHNSRITDMSRAGIYSGFGHIEMSNTAVGNAGLYGLYALGGRVIADHCTFANHFPAGRNSGTVGLFNRYDDGMGQFRYRALNQADFANCIIWGSRTSEVSFGHGSNAAFDYRFEGSLLRLDPTPDQPIYDVTDGTYFTSCLLNADPQFVDTYSWNYALDSASQAVNIGLPPAAQRVPLDALGHSRVNSPDAGLLERD